MPLGERVTQPSEENRWYQRRTFWFASGILADRRTGVDRRTRGERRAELPAALVSGADDRRSGSTRRAARERRAAERRLIDRRPVA